MLVVAHATNDFRGHLTRLHRLMIERILGDNKLWELYSGYACSTKKIPEIDAEDFGNAAGNHLFDDKYEELGIEKINGHEIRAWWQQYSGDRIGMSASKTFTRFLKEYWNMAGVEKYVRFEIKKNLIIRNCLLGIRLSENGQERRDNIMSFNSTISKIYADKMVEELCNEYNKQLEEWKNSLQK